MFDFTAVCAPFYAERRIFTIDAILAMGRDVPHDCVQVQGTAIKLLTQNERRYTLKQHYTGRFN
jgi:hypothetical protein